MDEKQNEKFDEWWDGTPKSSRYHFDDRGQGYDMAKRAWDACLEANKIERRIEVEVWMNRNGGIRITANPQRASSTFWVEDWGASTWNPQNTKSRI